MLFGTLKLCDERTTRQYVHDLTRRRYSCYSRSRNIEKEHRACQKGHIFACISRQNAAGQNGIYRSDLWLFPDGNNRQIKEF
jgi:hypothetical protein